MKTTKIKKAGGKRPGTAWVERDGKAVPVDDGGEPTLRRALAEVHAAQTRASCAIVEIRSLHGTGRTWANAQTIMDLERSADALAEQAARIRDELTPGRRRGLSYMEKTRRALGCYPSVRP